MWIWDSFVVQPMINGLLLIYALIGGNFGLAIILFTVLIKLLTHPAMASQIKSSAAMQDLMQSEEWQKIQAKYKDDKEKLAQEQMRVYQENGINPFGSCLPSLIQFPIIIGLYQSITQAAASSPLQALHLVRSLNPFLETITPAASLANLIPLNNHFLWMNLGQPERILADIVPFGGIPTLAIIVGLTTYIQSKLTVMPSANPNDQSAQMAQTMSLTMPFFLFYISLNFPSGLAVYFIASNVAGIIQYAMLGKVNWGNLFRFSPVTATPASSSLAKKNKGSKRP